MLNQTVAPNGTDNGRVATLDALQAVIANPAYNFARVAGHNSNASATFEGTVGDINLEVSLFEGYRARFSINIAFGEVRNIWKNHTPLGEFGMVDISSSWNEVMPREKQNEDDIVVGSGIPGYRFQGLGYRVGLIGPKDRCAGGSYEWKGIQMGHDGYVQVADPLLFGLTLRHVVAQIPQLTNPITGQPGSLAAGLWEGATVGW